MSAENEPTTAEGHWASRDPEGQPPRAAVLGLPRQVSESRLRIGPGATPADVLDELKAAGLDVTEEQVEDVWETGE